MKRKSRDQDPPLSNPASPTLSAITNPTQSQEVPTTSRPRQRLAVAASSSRPQTWFGRFSGGNSNGVGGDVTAPIKQTVESQEVLSKEEAEFRRGLGMVEGMEGDRTLRVNGRAQGAVDPTSSDTGRDGMDVVMEDAERKDFESQDSDMKGEESLSATTLTLRPKKLQAATAANRSTWFWNRAGANQATSQDPSEVIDSISGTEEQREINNEEPEQKFEIPSSVSSYPVMESPSSSPSNLQPPQFNTIRQSGSSYSSPLRRLWGGTTEEVAGQSMEQQPVKDSVETRKEVVPAQSAALQIEASSASPTLATSKGSEWFWSRRGQTLPKQEIIESSSSSLPPQNESCSPSFPRAEASALSSQVTQSDSASYSANQGYTYSSYLASWIPTWRTKTGVTDAGDTSEDVKMNSEPQVEAQTPAQKIRAEALARPEVQREPSSSSLPISLDPNTSVLNSVTKKGWVAYFSSKR